jgi:hypothetical protein
MEPDDPRIAGVKLGDRPNGKFHYHVLQVPGPPTIHVTRSHRPEIVLFGANHALQLPLVLDAGPRIMVNGLRGDQITVSRFSPDEPTQERVVPPNVDAVIHAIVDLSGEYPDVVQMLRQAKACGALASRLREDALPDAGTPYEREKSTGGDAEDEGHLLTASE